MKFLSSLFTKIGCFGGVAFLGWICLLLIEYYKLKRDCDETIKQFELRG